MSSLAPTAHPATARGVPELPELNVLGEPAMIPMLRADGPHDPSPLTASVPKWDVHEVHDVQHYMSAEWQASCASYTMIDQELPTNFLSYDPCALPQLAVPDMLAISPTPDASPIYMPSIAGLEPLPPVMHTHGPSASDVGSLTWCNALLESAYLRLSAEYPAAFSAPDCIAPALIDPAVSGETIYDTFGLEISDHPLSSGHSQRTRSSSTSSRATSSSSSTTFSPYPSSSSSPKNPALISYKRRNTTVTSAAARRDATPSDRWKCPKCSYVQRNHRKPELKRHIATHEDGDSPYVCCGVPLMEARSRGVPETVLFNEEVFEFRGLHMVGGCWRTFSRRDAFMRHLRREEGKCFGDALADYQLGNAQRR